MHPRKYFTLNFLINEIFCVKKFLNYGIFVECMECLNEDVKRKKDRSCTLLVGTIKLLDITNEFMDSVLI